MRLKVDLLPKKDYRDTVIVVDVLRATTTATIILQGTEQLFITPSLATARGFADQYNLLLAGEKEGLPPEGFNYGASPADLRKVQFERDVVLTTDNSPHAIGAVLTAKHVLLGSFYNARAVVDAALALATEEISIVCAGMQGDETLEDIVCAGFLARRIQKLRQHVQPVELKDAARLAMSLLQAFPDVQEALMQSTSGMMLGKLGLLEDIAVSSLISQSDVVPTLENVIHWDGRPIYRFGHGNAEPDHSEQETLL
jgi:2-phosphosulfolactate phosphatase